MLDSAGSTLVEWGRQQQQNDILYKKNEFIGIRGTALNWIKGYLSARKQYVELRNVRSLLENIVCGVPHGSILGPLLFVIYINDICNVSIILKCVLFADDASIFISNKDIAKLYCETSRKLNKLYIWLSVNKLSINIEKTNYIVFSNQIYVTSIGINNIILQRVYSMNILGVSMDYKLTWK